VKCRDGHASSTADFCSECGLEIGAAPAAFADDPTPVPRQLCPACSTDRDDPSSPFCGVCGFNFVTRTGGHVVAQAPPPAVAKPSGAGPHVARVALPPTKRIEIEVTFDESHAEAPKGQPVRKFALYDDESLIGRRSSSVAQTVGLDGDDFLSRRHLLIVRNRNGYVARLFDNTNGGAHNGVAMEPGVEIALADGDTLTIGSFTRIRVTTTR
jgi:hypothetical protein